MIKIHVKYKEIYSGLGNYYFDRIIKYKLPSNLFYTEKRSTLSGTRNSGNKIAYMKGVDNILNNIQKEKERVKDIVLQDIEEQKIGSKSRQIRIKNAGFSMEIDMSSPNGECPHGHKDWDDCPDCRH